MSKQQEPNHRRLPTDISFYNDRPPMKDSARRLLTEYSHIPEDQIDSHVEDIVSITIQPDMSVLTRYSDNELSRLYASSRMALTKLLTAHSFHIHALE